MTDPNSQQRELIDGTEGLYLVDAGPGTGKTFTVTRRYANIVDQTSVDPDDVLLVTFTNNAATEMKERIVDHCSYGMRELSDAPIQTFHSLCHDILQEHGHDAPTHLGIDDRITGSTRIVDDDIVEGDLFREFVDKFGDDNPEYADLFRALSDPAELLDLIEQLAAKGVFPTEDGWYRNGERHLDGDFEAFRNCFDEANRPQNGGNRQSQLRSDLYRYGKNKLYLPDAPTKAEIRGDGKAVPDDVARRAFDEDRSALKAFVHDVYYEYLRFALRRNYLTFGFLQLFAFVLLCEDRRLREDLSFEYAMVDEFQDSSEIQFKLALLLGGTNNLCVVGDWKQSIYSFQYAAVENITAFEDRLDRFTTELNDDEERVAFDPESIRRVELVENYRSTETILDFSEEALVTPAAGRDEVDAAAVLDDVVSLRSNCEYDQSRIEALRHDDECEAVLSKVQEIVGNEQYAVEEDGELRPPDHEDVAVLTRTRDFGRDLLDVAREHDVPMAYDGGVELFRTDAAKLLLAWLRILERDADRGWAVVLERADYTLDEIDHSLSSASYPEAMVAFREELDAMETVGGIARRVFARYGYEGAYADVLLHTIQSVHEATTLTRGDLIRFVERGIEDGSTHEVQTSAGANSVTVQTIHSAKGLEYPIVILANMNDGRFPPNGGGASTVTYEEPVGLRQRKLYAEAHGHPHRYDNWHVDVLRRCLPRNYDEERRLLYVALTRAEAHVVFTAGEEPNAFLESLPVDIEEYSPDVERNGGDRTEQATLRVSIPEPEGPDGYSPHSLMDESVFEEVEEGRGMAFGTRVHEFAEQYAIGNAVSPEGADERNVAAFVDDLSGDVRVEEEAYLPLSVDGGDVTIAGVVDLVHVRPDRVEIVDYKTDRSRHAETEYRKQLSVYFHVADAAYPDREVSAAIFYTDEGEQRNVEPYSKAELRNLVDRAAPTAADEPSDRRP